MGIIDAVCISCSSIMRWNPGTQRICNACVEQRKEDQLTLVKIRMGNERDVKRSYQRSMMQVWKDSEATHAR